MSVSDDEDLLGCERAFFPTYGEETVDGVIRVVKQRKYTVMRECSPKTPSTVALMNNKDWINSYLDSVVNLRAIMVSDEDSGKVFHYGTAFYVAPNVLLTARHNVDQTRVEYETKSIFFTNAQVAVDGDFEDKFLKWGADPSEEGTKDIEEECETNKYARAKLIKSSLPDHRRNWTVMLKKTKDETKVWKSGEDFSFLETKIPVKEDAWLVPCGNIPSNDSPLALVGYSPPGFKQENVSKKYGEARNYYALLHKVFEANRKYVSAGNLVPDGTNETAFGHSASSETAFSGGPILLTSDDSYSGLFAGIHIGAFARHHQEWNHAYRTDTPNFCEEWFNLVYKPHLSKILNEIPRYKKKQLQDYLQVVQDKCNSTVSKEAAEALKIIAS